MLLLGFVPKTLVLNLSGTMIHSEYKLGSGFEILKRPGLDYFLQRIIKYYEVVIFADEDLFVKIIEIWVVSIL
jgi:mitochondrial import inner membrane translocase subunit TIM50